MNSLKKTNRCPALPLCIAAVFILLATAVFATPLPVDEAWPMVGTGGHGHTYPGATVPFGFVQLSPDTRTDGWDACPGYNYADTNILGFSHTHLSGTGGIDLGELLILPITGSIKPAGRHFSMSAKQFQSGFSHDNEVAQPGYYSVTLDRYDVRAELTASAHCGMHRYTFPPRNEAHLLVDLVHGLGNPPTAAEIKVESKTTLSGKRSNNGWAKGKTLYFIIKCSRPFDSVGLYSDGKPLPSDQTEIKAKNLAAHLDFNLVNQKPVVLRIGLSSTGLEEARKNLQTEMPDFNFDAARKRARDLWNEHLSRIEIQSDNNAFRQTFYSALYHTMMAPTLYNDADGSYIGPDRQVHPTADFQYYSTMSLWDVFRGETPLLTITEPERINDFVKSMLAFYRQSPDHALPVWPLASYETWCMPGYHSVPVIYDAYAKGFRNWDAELAFEAMTNTAMNSRRRQDEYQKCGYIPWIKGQGAATSRTLEYAYDDWCIAQLAKALGKTDAAELFSKRAAYYTNVWDPKAQFFRAPLPDGTFPEPFDPKEVASGGDTADGNYTEADAWQYMFFVPHDVPGMIQLYGGKQAFIKRLDEFFNEDSDMSHWRIDVTGLVGQYAHGNEPDQHVPYLYALAGAPYKTAERVRQIQLTQYDNSPEGLCGNDDCGQISAWYVWSALGLYPVNPSSGVYVIGAPLVEKAVIHLDSKYYKGGTFTIIVRSNTHYARADKMDNYIQSAKLNGRPLEHPWITHEEIAHGGTLEFTMGILPNKTWATGN